MHCYRNFEVTDIILKFEKNLVMYKSIICAVILAGTMVSAGVAAKHEPYQGSRIYWDLSSQQEIFSSGNYARIIQLQDSRLMAAAESGGGISVAYSSNNGKTWSAPELIARGGSDIPNCVPDLAQLSDGTIIVGYNPRPKSPYSDDRKFGIRAVRSVDNGKTWSSPIFIYDAHSTYADGCWEPSFLELPSGELHCYFANEKNFTQSNEQEISMCRSFDGGKTWGEASRICYRKGSRDGMPSAIITDSGEIVVIVEDNGWPGFGGFRATTVRCPLEENWSKWVDAGSDRRDMIFANASDKDYKSAAPYLRKLKSGETIASWQGDHWDRKGNPEDKYDMFVAVGDADARNFKAVSQPFGVTASQHSLWNSVAVAGDGTVFALASIGDANHGNAINVMTGYAMTGFEANFGTPVVDASFSGEAWTCKNARQIYMGTQTRNRSTMDFLYDDDNLYFYGRVVDRTIYTDKSDNDGIFLYLDVENACDTYPQKGMFRIFMNTDGTITFSSGNNNKWVTESTVPDGIEYKTNLRSSYYDMEIAVPWKALGLDKAPVGKTMRCNVEVRDRRDGDIKTETIPDANARQSWTWPEFKLNPGSSSVDEVTIGGSESSAVVSVSGRSVNILSGAREMESVTIYNTSGIVVASDSKGGDNLTLSVADSVVPAIVRVVYRDGGYDVSKVSIR